MSKQQTRRKITLDSPLKQVHSHSNPTKDTLRRPSVFERLGTKAITSNPGPGPGNSSQCSAKPTEGFCRQWEQNGSCQYGKNCKYVSTHALISPSKRAAIKDASSKTNNKSCSSSSSSGSSSTGSESTSSEDTSSSGSSESVESSRHHRHRAKHLNSKKLKRYSSSSDKEHSKRNNIRVGKGVSPNKKVAHTVPAVNASALHREMKHTKKRRSRDRSDGRSSPRKGGLASASGLKKSLSPPGRSSNANSHKRRSQSPLLKSGKLSLQSSKLGLNSRSVGVPHNARSPPNHKGSRERDRNREKEEREREREREIEKEKERERENKKFRDRELEKQREREKDREKEREKDRNRSRSPKMKLKEAISRSPRKELKRKESPDPHHNKPGRLSGGSQKGRDDGASSKHKLAAGEHWHRKDDKEEERKRGDERRHKEDSRKDARLLTSHNEKELMRDRERDRDRERERVHDREREKDKAKSLLQQGIPSLLTLNLHANDFNAHVASGGKERGGERNRSLERTGLLRNISMDRGRERSLDRVSERSRGSERDRRCRNNNGGLEKGLDHSGLAKEFAKALSRNREQDRTFERSERAPERGLERGLDRGLERGLERGHDRGHDRGLDRGPDRGLDRLDLDRSLDRGLERMDRNAKNERSLDRASPRVLERDTDRGLERGLDRDPVQGRLERGFDRALERGLDRGSPRLDRDHRFSDRSPGDRLFVGTHLDHREPEDKGFDGVFEGRRDRGRFSDQNRYEKGVPLNDDRRMGQADAVGFNEERRRGRESNRQEGRVAQWDGRNDRKRDHNHDREHGRDRDHGQGPRPYDGQRPPGPNNAAGKRNDWEWEGRGRRPGKDWDGPHRPDNSSLEKDWGRFPPGQGDWSGPPNDRRSGGWSDEWCGNNQNSPAAQLLQNRPPGRMLPLRDDSQNLLHKNDDVAAEEGSKVKDPAISNDSKCDIKADGIENDSNHVLNHKRTREIVEGDDASGDSKRPYLEKDSALDEVLSDISDDADEILNREDSELNQLSHVDVAPGAGKDSRLGNQQSALLPQGNQTAHSHHRRTAEGGENAGNLGFEEISDGELEEEARARGISDALGVDWASLVAETRPRLKIEKAGSTRQRWEGVTLLTYIGLSVDYAGPKLVKYILNSALSPKQEISDIDSTSKVDNQDVVSGSLKTENTDAETISSGAVGPTKQETNAKSEGICESVTQCSDSKKENSEDHPSINETVKLDSTVTKSSLAENSVKSGSEISPLATEPEMVPYPQNKDTSSDSKCLVKSNCLQPGGEESTCEPQKEKHSNQENKKQDKQQCFKLLHPVAGIHAALLERKARRQALFSSSGPYKRALSARRDLAIRRQLCNLPPRETTCDNSPAADELFRLSLQLLERAS